MKPNKQRTFSSQNQREVAKEEVAKDAAEEEVRSTRMIRYPIAGSEM